MTEERPIKVAVLMGGTSRERKISLKSGRAVVRALSNIGLDVVAVDLRKADMKRVARLQPDVAFIALHGGFGENGEIQRELEKAGIPYTGSGPYASGQAFDKVRTKSSFAAHGVPTPAFRIVRKDTPPGVVLNLADVLGFPVVIKPRSQGSSFGVTFHRSANSLMDGVKEALRHDGTAIMERAVVGREITVGILCNAALPLIEIRSRRKVFDFKAKYEDPETQYKVHPDMDVQEIEAVQEVALRAHHALRCADFSRVDLILTDEGEPMVLEVNTIPGLTERSLLPKAAAAAGIHFPDLCRFIVDAAMARCHSATIRRKAAS
jgi:D-alanine-D-alanine ligase